MPEKPTSRIFAGAKVLGYVSTHVPFVARFIKRRGETLLCTSVGKWFHTYGCNKFRLLTVSGEHPGPITCMSGDNYHIYTASANNIYAWRRGCELKHVYKGHKAPVRFLFPFGPHLISIDEANVLKIFDIKETTEFLELKFDKDFSVSALCHPPTYLNKVLLGSQQGPLQIWNLRTSKLVYTFKGWKCSVLLLEPAPAVDVVAIVLSNAKILLHNLKLDQIVMEFIHDWGICTSLSFRLDGAPIMITGSHTGNIVLWNLEEQRVVSQVQQAHSAAIAGMQCLMSEPLMVTNSADNSLKLWIFDMPDGGPRLLRLREGHSQPPNVVRFCEPSGTNLLTAGGDSRLHIMNTISETFNKNLGKASYNRRRSKRKMRLQHDKLILPPITTLSSCMQRDKQWASIAALHKDLYVSSTWSYHRMCMGDHKLTPQGQLDKTVVATCLTVTHCGNFVLIGYTTGHVQKFNMQSGLHRGIYGSEKSPAHKGAVRGVETDICNQRVITAGADETLKFWHFKDEVTTPYNVLRLSEAVSMTKCHRESALLAIANEDFSITLVDIDTMKVVRRFDGHSGKINDIEFDPQSRWLITSSMDCTVCTWDIPTAQLVDIFSVDEPCTSLSMSPTGDYLATTHVGEIGVFLWANRMLYERIFLKPIDRSAVDVPRLTLPSTAPEKPNIEDLAVVDLADEPEYKSPEQISKELITLSDQPTSRWLNLLNLDIVKKRNKSKTLLTVPKSAPFFLPTIPSLELQFDVDKDKVGGETKMLMLDDLSTLSVFAKKLVKCETEENFNTCVQKLKAMAPAAIEAEVSSMAPEVGGSEILMKQFLLMLDVMHKTNRDFELAQSYLSIFLKTHTKVIAQNEELRNTLASVEQTSTQAWCKLQSNLLYNICVVKALKDMY